MEYRQPIKRHEALVPFSRDHHYSLLLVWKIRHGMRHSLQPERISDYVVFFFTEDLQHHFKEEEKFLFSRLPAKDKLRIRAEKEHKQIYELYSRIGKNRGDISLLKQFADLLESHIRYEEITLYEHLQNNVPEEILSDILIHSIKQTHDVDSRWADKFWDE
jgi:hemerythrin-like domain-containing protein